MSSVNPTPEQLARFERDADTSGSIVMLNLLRFRELADYGNRQRAAISGRAAYGCRAQ